MTQCAVVGKSSVTANRAIIFQKPLIRKIFFFSLNGSLLKSVVIRVRLTLCSFKQLCPDQTSSSIFIDRRICKANKMQLVM